MLAALLLLAFGVGVVKVTTREGVRGFAGWGWLGRRWLGPAHLAGLAASPGKSFPFLFFVEEEKEEKKGISEVLKMWN